MRIILFVNFLVLLIFPALGQQSETNIFRQFISLTGPGFKILNQQEYDLPVYRIGLTLGINLPNKPGDKAFDATTLDSISTEIFNNQELSGKLIEEFGGEFYQGEPGGTGKISNIRMSPAFQWGFAIDRSLGRSFRLGIDFQHRRNELTAEFPVTVIPFNQEEPYTTSGHLSSKVTFNLLGIKGTYFFSHTRIMPYIGLGLSGNWQNQGQTSVQLGNQKFDLTENPSAEGFLCGSLQCGAMAAINNFISLAADIQYLLPFQNQDQVNPGGASFSIGLFFGLN